MRFRGWNRLRAEIGGYFWTDCPLCGQWFGGHEWRDIDGNVSTIPKPDAGPGVGTAICPDCTRAGRGYLNLASWQ